VQAQRNLQLLERELSAAAPAIWGGYAVAIVSLTLLTAMWVTFYVFDKGSTTMLTVITPVLVGLFTIATLLPSLVRLKLPGFEANLEAGVAAISSGPTGDVTLSSGRLTLTTGPVGQFARMRYR
jgi:hypothetical protein